MLTQDQLDEYKAQCNGSEDFHRGGLPPIIYTDGVEFIAKEAEAYWLIDAIASHQIYQKVRMQPFQVWKLSKRGDNRWFLSCKDGNDNFVTGQDFEYTDFPLDEVVLWLENGTLMIPEER